MVEKTIVKVCPYCAEDIDEQATQCPYCRSNLTVPVPRPGEPLASEAPPHLPVHRPPAAPTPPASSPLASAIRTVGEGAVRFSHSGERYILGYGTDFFGIWDRTVPGGPVMRFPRTDAGWNEAWNRFSAMEPRLVQVPLAGTAAPDLRGSSTPYRSGHALALWLTGLFGAIVVMSFVLMGFRFGRIHSLRTLTDLLESRNRVIGAAGVLDILALVTGVLWLVWQHRAQSNLRALGAADLRFTPGWAVGWWLIPVANFAMPYLTTRELLKASDPTAGAVDWKTRPTGSLLPLWWAAWLGRAALTGIALSIAGQSSSDVDRLVRQQSFGIAADLATIAAAILALLVVRRVDRRQRARHGRQTGYAASFGVGQ